MFYNIGVFFIVLSGAVLVYWLLYMYSWIILDAKWDVYDKF